MRTVTVTFDDGSTHVYNGVPREVTPDQIISRVAKDFPNKRATNIDGGSSATPKGEIPNSAPAMTPYERRQWEAQGAQAGLAVEEPKLRDMTVAPFRNAEAQTPEQFKAAAQARHAQAGEVAKLRRQAGAVSETGAAVGNAIGGAAGGVAGAFTGPAAPFAVPALSILGGAAGSYLGGLFDASGNEMTDAEAREYLRDKVLEGAAYDAVGNLLFFGGGKILAMRRALKPGHAASERAAGKLVTPANPDTGLNAPRAAIRPGDSVFGATGDELKDAAVSGAKILGEGETSTVTKGQLTGEPGFVEKFVRTKDKGYFDDVRRAQEGRLQGFISKITAKMRGAGAQYAGADVRKALDMTEREVKAYLRPVWEDLAKKHDEIVDFSGISGAARKALDANANSRVPLLKGEELEWTRRLANGGDKISPAEAQDIASRFSAMARDLDSDIAPNSPLRSFVTDVAAKTRAALDKALAGEPQYAEARDLYKRMMETVYDPAFRASRRGGESAAGDKVIRIGEVEGAEALRKLEAFAKEVDILASTKLAPQAGAARRGALSSFFDDYAGTPEALANLPRKMGDPQFRRTFLAAFPDAQDRKLVETLAQAAQTVKRLQSAGGGAPGVEAAGASAGRTAGAPGGSFTANLLSLAGRVATWLAPKTLSRAMTEQSVRSELPRIARVIQAGKLGALNALPEATQAVMARLDEIAAEEDAAEEQP